MSSCSEMLSKHWEWKFPKATQIYWCSTAATAARCIYGVVSDRSEQGDPERLRDFLHCCFWQTVKQLQLELGNKKIISKIQILHVKGSFFLKSPNATICIFEMQGIFPSSENLETFLANSNLVLRNKTAASYL